MGYGVVDVIVWDCSSTACMSTIDWNTALLGVVDGGRFFPIVFPNGWNDQGKVGS